MAKHSEYERQRRAAETARVKEIEDAWQGSLPAQVKVRPGREDRPGAGTRGSPAGHGARNPAATATTRP